ncbi:TRAP transporter small permease subunit [Azospirillum sp. A29]|uniref:TRAP transporter small permease subunit n=1 Tax=unclassified Azospirillum TaxID=2630922 RepID=UPI00366D5E19
MRRLLALSRDIDWFNERLGYIANWFVFAACMISAGNAVMRYTFNYSSNAWLEIQWYLFGAMFMLGASYTLKVNGHVRVDLVYGHVGPRAKLWIDVFGTILFLLPMTIIIGWLSWSMFFSSLTSMEYSSNAGGLIRWPIKFCLPFGFLMLTAQGLSELIKRIAALRGDADLVQSYERPVQ